MYITNLALINDTLCQQQIASRKTEGSQSKEKCIPSFFSNKIVLTKISIILY